MGAQWKAKHREAAANADAVITSGGVSVGEADFTRADLTGASFREADLLRTRFFRAKLREADFTGARMRGTDFLNADLSGALWIDGQRRCAEGSIGQCQ